MSGFAESPSFFDLYPKQIALDAAARFDALLALDERVPEREELRAAGVPSRTLATLYPYDFGALVPGLMQLLNDDCFRHLGQREDWTAMISLVERRERSLDKQQREALRREQASCATSEPYAALFAHVFDRLPMVTQKRFATESLLFCLLTSCWLMANEPPSAEKWLTQEVFVAVVDRLLPSLAGSQEASLLSAKA